jgi:hypothetical protein
MTTRKNNSTSKIELPEVPHWIHRLLSYAGGIVMLYMMAAVYNTVTSDHEKVVDHQARIMIIEKKVGLAYINRHFKLPATIDSSSSNVDSSCWICEMILPEQPSKKKK